LAEFEHNLIRQRTFIAWVNIGGDIPERKEVILDSDTSAETALSAGDIRVQQQTAMIAYGSSHREKRNPFCASGHGSFQWSEVRKELPHELHFISDFISSSDNFTDSAFTASSR
jgi:hypothetical protein